MRRTTTELRPSRVEIQAMRVLSGDHRGHAAFDPAGDKTRELPDPEVDTTQSLLSNELRAWEGVLKRYATWDASGAIRGSTISRHCHRSWTVNGRG
jgi:hypothetical protein